MTPFVYLAERIEFDNAHGDFEIKGERYLKSVMAKE